MASFSISPSSRIRQTACHEKVVALGVKGFTVYNHMLLPTYFESVEADYDHLVKYVQLWDVSCERQVKITGPDALRLVEYMTPRDISKCKLGQCMYAPLVDENGGIVNDPIILKITEDEYWLSIADSDVLLWAKGLAHGLGLNVEITEPEIYPLAVQGPLSNDLMASVFGDWVYDLKFFYYKEFELEGMKFIIARSGWSKQGGFEIYLNGKEDANRVWDIIWEAGKVHNIRPGCPNLVERIESGLLSYGNDMTLMNNPFEVNLGKYCQLDKAADYISRKALKAVEANGVTQHMQYMILENEEGIRVQPNSDPLAVTQNGVQVGSVRSSAYSIKYQASLAFTIIDAKADLSGNFEVVDQAGTHFKGIISNEKWEMPA